MQLRLLVRYLDHYLNHAAFRDVALNGLQVEANEEVHTVALAVDASLASIEAALDGQAHLLLVHHGLFWGSVEPLTGMLGQRVRKAMQGNLSIYASHLPLDAHPHIGNNARLARLMGFEIGEPMGDFRGTKAGYLTDAPHPYELPELVAHLATILNIAPADIRVWGEAKRPIRRIGIVSGGAASSITEAVEIGCDAYVTGEPHYSAIFPAIEYGVPLICAGHYNTETLGVQALGQHLVDQFNLRTFFIDGPTGI